jgi:hypothetical protein
MAEFVERLCLGLVVVGVILLMLLCGQSWLPLSASDNFRKHERPKPALLGWPHHDEIEDRA